MDRITELVFKGKNFLDSSNFEDALACFEQALLLNQNDPELWNLKAVSLRSLGRYEEAVECFHKSLGIDPRDRNAS